MPKAQIVEEIPNLVVAALVAEFLQLRQGRCETLLAEALDRYERRTDQREGLDAATAEFQTVTGQIQAVVEDFVAGCVMNDRIPAALQADLRELCSVAMAPIAVAWLKEHA
jgi:ATP/maltotriose-dependent transcriptional regulator MalT